MGLPEEMAIGDAGYMIRRCDIFGRHYTEDRCGVAFMPHFFTATSTTGLREVCEGIGIRYIDTGEPEEAILAAIAGSKLLITEALHGAIISDALRVPWIAVKSSENIFEFKWRDFCASIRVDYAPVPIRVRWDVRSFTGRHPRNLSRYVLNRLRSKASQALISPSDTAFDLLLAMGRPPTLSSDAVLAGIDEGIQRRLDQFFEDCACGSVFA
jgi:succinoglycan biosynthesis protein ExoV